MADRTCFGFFVGDDECQRCSAAKKCKAVLVTHGFDVAAGVLDDLIETLEPGATFEVDAEELLLDTDTSPASDEEKKRSRVEANRVYDQLVKGGAVSGPAAVNPSVAVEPDKVSTSSI